MKSKELKKMCINIRVCLKGCLPHLTANVGTPSLFPSGLRPCLGSPCGCSFRGCWPRGNSSRGFRLSPPFLLTVFCFFVAVLASLSWLLMSFSFFPQTMNSPCRSWLLIQGAACRNQHPGWISHLTPDFLKWWEYCWYWEFWWNYKWWYYVRSYCSNLIIKNC